MLIALDVDRELRYDALDGICLDVVFVVAFRQLLELLAHALRAVRLIRLAELLDLLVAVLRAERRETLLADARRADAGEIVAVPHLRHAVVHLRDLDDVRDILVISLDLDARPVDRALLEHVARRRRVRARNGVADIRLMPLRDCEEHQLPSLNTGAMYV